MYRLFHLILSYRWVLRLVYFGYFISIKNEFQKTAAQVVRISDIPPFPNLLFCGFLFPLTNCEAAFFTCP